MRYGHFDEKTREYVIENPATPMSWVNYLGTDKYCGIISNNAAGYSFHESPRSRRLLRFRFNSLPMDRPGRYVYLRDEETSEFWSATWQPVGKPLDKYKSECRHGMGYSKFTSEYLGIRTTMRVFVPVDRPVEFWELEVENISGRTRKLSLFPYAEWCFWMADQDMSNFQWILYTCRMAYDSDIIDFSLRFAANYEPKGFMASMLPVKDFDTDREVFIGNYRSETNPASVEAGKCSNSIAIGGNACAAVRNEMTLKAGDKKWTCWVVGVGDAKKQGREAKRLFSDRKRVAAEFVKVQEYWTKRLSKFAVRTPSTEVNVMANVWNQYQCHTTFNWSRSASFVEAGGRDGLGFRDTNQDTLGVVHSIPDLVKARLLDLLKGQYADGSAMHSVQPLSWTQGNHNQSSHIFSDDHLWLLLSVPAYIKETGTVDFVNEEAPFADRGKGIVYEHLRRAADFSWKKKGPHGVLLGLAADWNDCINLKGKGESMFSTFLYYHGLCELIDLARHSSRSADAKHFMGYRDDLRKAIEKCAWDGDWFLRGFLDNGKPLGGKKSEQSRIFINSQTWAAICGAVSREQSMKAMDSLKRYLATEHGIVKNYPAYRRSDELVGAITNFPPGLKENAGIFCHANTWAVVAECILGRGDRAYEYYRSFLPAAKNDTADKYTMEPYVYSQFITGKEHPYHFGRARNSWLTGTASWAYVALTQYILGIKPDYDGLLINPTTPTKWEGFEATRVFRGATYQIKVRNPHRIAHGVRRMKVDGREILGHRVPAARAGATVKVEIVLEK